MVRVPVPDDFDRGVVVVTPAERVASAVVGGYDRNADIEVDDPALARDLQVREDEDGRYVGVHEALADRVADYLGTSTDAESGASGDASDDTGSGSDSGDADDTASDGGTCEVVKADGEVCGRQQPCPYHSDDAED